MDGKFEVAFLGTNGSCAYNGGRRKKYGTNTLCVAARAGGETLIFDSGSGICGFGGLEGFQREHCHIFFSHYHIDHFSGFLFFSQFFDAEKSFDIYGASHEGKDFYGVVNQFISPPLHPIHIGSFNAGIRYNTISAGEEIAIGNGVKVRTYPLSHPSGTVGYRVECGGKAFCYCTDIELAEHLNDEAFEAFTHKADLLVLDTFFDDGGCIPGWGHSSWREAAQWAKRVDAKKLALFHYGYRLEDEDIDEMERRSRKIFPNTFAASDFMRVEL